MFYLVYPDLQQRRPHWPLYGTWYAFMDLPPGTYWHPFYRAQPYLKERNRQDRPILPGEVIELVVVLTTDRPQSYHGLPLRHMRDRVHVLRRVRLADDYSYDELFRSPLYTQWRLTGQLEAYNLRPLPSSLPSSRQRRSR